MEHVGAPAPWLSALIAVVMELVAGLLIVFGILVRPLALVLAVYTLVTALIGDHFWTFSGAERMQMMIHFYKNISILGGLLALATCGPGKYVLKLRR
jgi:putative oxidoreductase